MPLLITCPGCKKQYYERLNDRYFNEDSFYCIYCNLNLHFCGGLNINIGRKNLCIACGHHKIKTD